VQGKKSKKNLKTGPWMNMAAKEARENPERFGGQRV
jgi:hypothetical protein